MFARLFAPTSWPLNPTVSWTPNPYDSKHKLHSTKCKHGQVFFVHAPAGKEWNLWLQDLRVGWSKLLKFFSSLMKDDIHSSNNAGLMWLLDFQLPLWHSTVLSRESGWCHSKDRQLPQQALQATTNERWLSIHIFRPKKLLFQTIDDRSGSLPTSLQLHSLHLDVVFCCPVGTQTSTTPKQTLYILLQFISLYSTCCWNKCKGQC